MDFDAAQARANVSIQFVNKDFSKYAVYPAISRYLLDYLQLNSLFKNVLKTKSAHSSFSSTEYLITLFSVIFLGIKRLYKVDDLLFDEQRLAQILGFRHHRFPCGRQLYRILNQATHWSVKRLDTVNLRLLLKNRLFLTKTRWLTIDIDQTKKITESKTIQKAKPCFNATKKGRMGLRISAGVVNKLVVSQKLEPGNIGNNSAFEEIFQDILSKVDLLLKPEIESGKPVALTSQRAPSKPSQSKRMILRVDGGYFDTNFINLVEKERQTRRLDFIVRAKKNLALVKTARTKIEKKHKQQGTGDGFTRPFPHRDLEVMVLKDQAILPKVSHHYKVLVIKDKQKQIKSHKGRIIHSSRKYEYLLVTSLTTWSTKRIIRYYKQRQTIENIFKEQNQSFKADKLPSHSFWGNAFYYQMVFIVGNVSFFFQATVAKRNA